MIPRNIHNANWFKHQFVVKEDDGLHDYLQEYAIAIKQRETKRMALNHRSTQLIYRRSLVDYLRSCINNHHLSSHCFHLAIYLLDITMDRNFIHPLHLYLIANTCLLLAAKCEEKLTRIPNMSDLNKGAHCNYSKFEHASTEISILELSDWYLLIPTAVHFVEFYMIRVIDEYDLKHNNRRNSKSLRRQIKKIVSKYLYEIVDDIHYIHSFPPSQQAAAIIFAARRATGLRGWSQQLQRFTGYYKQQLQEPLNILYRNNNYTYW